MTSEMAITPRDSQGDRYVSSVMIAKAPGRWRVVLLLMVALALGNTPAAQAAGDPVSVSTSHARTVFPEFPDQPREFAYRLDASRASNVTIKIVDSGSVTVRTLTTSRSIPAGRFDGSWDLRDSAGQPAPAGNYTLVSRAVDSDGNVADHASNITIVRAGPPQISGISPGSQVSGEIELSLTVPADLDIRDVYFTSTSGCGSSAAAPVDRVFTATLDLATCAAGPQQMYAALGLLDAEGRYYYLRTALVDVVVSDATGPTLAAPQLAGTIRLATPRTYETPYVQVGVRDASGLRSLTATVSDASGDQVHEPVALYVYSYYGYAYHYIDATDDNGDPLPAGTYTITYVATDNIGNTTTKTTTFETDDTVPATLELAQDPELSTVDATVTIHDGLEASYVYVDVGGRDVVYAERVGQTDVWKARFDRSAYRPGDGDVSAYVEWYDGRSHGYRSATTTITFTDVAGPTLSAPQLNGPIRLTSATTYETLPVQVGVTDPSGVASITASITTSSGTVVRGPVALYVYSYYGYAYHYIDATDDNGDPLPAGTYTITYVATDNIGNTTTKTTTFETDDTVPATLELAQDPDSTRVTATVTTHDDVSSGSVHVELAGRATVQAQRVGDTDVWKATFDRSAYRAGDGDVAASVDWYDDRGHSYRTAPQTVTFVDDAGPSLTPQATIRAALASPTTYEMSYTQVQVDDVSGIASVTATITDSLGQLMREPVHMYITGHGYAYFYFTATDDDGDRLPAGQYTIAYTATDTVGNATTKVGELVLDDTVPGALTTPSDGGTLVGTAPFLYEPTAGVDIQQVDISVGNTGISIYNASPDGLWRTTFPVGTIPPGQQRLITTTYWVDSAGTWHSFRSAESIVGVDPSAIPVEIAVDLDGDVAPTTAKVKVTTSHPRGESVNVSVNWGDGSAIDRHIVESPYGPPTYEHTYTKAGRHTIVVTTSDEEGAFASASRAVTITSPRNDPPTVSATAGTSTVQVGEDLRLDIAAADPESAPLAYRVTFGDGSDATTGTYAAGLTISHRWTKPGTYSVRYQVSDGTHTTARVLRVKVLLPAPLSAAAGDARQSYVGDNVTFDGSGTTPLALIDSFEWSFGDGTTASGQRVDHVFATRGTYTVRLTVRSGEESATSTTKVTVAPVPVQPGLRVTVRGGGNLLEGALTSVSLPDGRRISASTGADGTATLHGLPDGTASINVYAPGYVPANVAGSLVDGGGDLSVDLQRGEVGTAVLETERLTLEEIEDRGIDVSAEENQHVYEAQVQLHFIEKGDEPGSYVPGTTTVTVISWPSGSTISCTESDSCSTQPGGGGGSGGTVITVGESTYTPTIEHVEGAPVIEWLVIPVRASFLKEFFDVSLIVQNLSPGFTFTDGTATLDLPAGLALATLPQPQALSRRVTDIPGGQQRTTTWTVRGDTEGEYDLSASFNGVLDPVDAPIQIEARSRDPLKVWGGSALEISVQADPTATRWAPYRVTVSLTNTTPPTTGPSVYNATLEALPRPADAPKGQARFVYAPGQPTSASKTVIKPGDRLALDLIVYPGIGTDIDVPVGAPVPEDAVTEMLLDAANSSVVQTGGTVTIPSAPHITTHGSDTPRLPLLGSAQPGSDVLSLNWQKPAGSITGYDLYTRDSLTSGSWRKLSTAPIPPNQTSLQISDSQVGVGAYFTLATLHGDGPSTAEHSLLIGAPRYAALGDSYSSGEGVPEFEAGTDTDREAMDTDLSIPDLYQLLTGTGKKNTCHRSSGGSYSQLLAADAGLGDALNPSVFAACSGAVAKDLVEANPRNDGEAAQTDVLSGFTDVVTLTMGGNDVGFEQIAKACIVPTGLLCGVQLGAQEAFGSQSVVEESYLATFAAVKDTAVAVLQVRDCVAAVTGIGLIRCFSTFRDAIEATKALANRDPDRDAFPSFAYGGELKQRLVTSYSNIAASAPTAQVLVGAYPKLFTDGQNAGCKVAPELLAVEGGAPAAVNGFVDRINSQIEAAVAEVNSTLPFDRIRFVPVARDFKGHELCKDGELNPDSGFHPIINPYLSWPDAYDSLSFSFHPNARGHRDYKNAFKRALADHRESTVSLTSESAAGLSTTLGQGTRSLTATARTEGPPVALELAGPDGSTLRAGDPGVTSGSSDGTTWITTERPAAGDWSVRVTATAATFSRLASAAAASGRLVDVSLDADTTTPSPSASGAVVRSGGSAWRFDGSASTTEGRSLEYRWSFADGTSLVGAVVTKEFADDEPPAAVLTVTAPDGASASVDVATAEPPRSLRLVEEPVLQLPDVVKAGAVVTVAGGRWTPTPSRVDVQWLRDGKIIPGADGRSHTVVTADEGRTLSVTLNPYRAGYTGGTATPGSIRVPVVASPATPTPTSTPPQPTPVPPAPTGPTAKRAAKISVKVSARSVKRSKRVTVGVAVKASGPAATGRVRITYGNKSVTLALRRGSVSVRLPKLKKGSYRIGATYLGSDWLLAARSKPVVVRVR